MFLYSGWSSQLNFSKHIFLILYWKHIFLILYCFTLNLFNATMNCEGLIICSLFSSVMCGWGIINPFYKVFLQPSVFNWTDLLWVRTPSALRPVNQQLIPRLTPSHFQTGTCGRQLVPAKLKPTGPPALRLQNKKHEQTLHFTLKKKAEIFLKMKLQKHLDKCSCFTKTFLITVSMKSEHVKQLPPLLVIQTCISLIYLEHNMADYRRKDDNAFVFVCMCVFVSV